MNRLLRIFCLLTLSILVHTGLLAQQKIIAVSKAASGAVMYEKVEFDIQLEGTIINPYDAREISVDAIFTAPSGKVLTLPVFFISGNETQSHWKARFAPQESGNYTYKVEVRSAGNLEAASVSAAFAVQASAGNGFLHANNKWSFRFDSGKPFRGIGENMAWEPRTWEDQDHTYDHFLPKYAANGVNFFRTWMSGWNLPMEWKKVGDTHLYSDSDEYFNPGAIKRMDELVEMADSLGLYIMLTLDWHGELSPGDWWNRSNYNAANGGPINTPAEFFTSEAAKAQYKNRLRYLVARWGYSTSIGSWEFFNEVDNAVAASNIPHTAVTSWHAEMSAYLKSIDPYDHLMTTSISHTEIAGLNAVPDLDFNQKHIYKNTGSIPAALNNYSSSTGKPYVIGEFGFEWDWNVDFSTITPELIFDYKRGLWYGLFNPTPVLPMSWWWEFFEEQGTNTYFAAVREISDQMLLAGKGAFTPVTSTAPNLETYALRVGSKYFVYLLNNSSSNVSNKELTLYISGTAAYAVKSFNPESRSYSQLDPVTAASNTVKIGGLTLGARESRVLVLTPAGSTDGEQSSFSGDAAPIPGKIEAEAFDKGGEGVAYHDFDAGNTGGEYRAEEGVDVKAFSGGGYYVTNLIKGEWLEFTIDIKKTATYTLKTRVAAADAVKGFYLEVDGQQISAPIEVSGTGGEQNWQNVSVNTLLLTQGKKVLRLVTDAADFSIDHMEFTLLNQAPSVSITAPAEGTMFELSKILTIEAAASDEDGAVAKVEFYSGNNKLGEDREAPYSFSWEGTAGAHALSAKAIDDQGLEVTSAAVHITVQPSQARSPYTSSGSPHAIPGKIEAEDFDSGGAGVVYQDVSPGNIYGQYRTDTDVDLEETTDEGGGYNLADIQAGEWVEYTVEVAESGTYDLSFRVATQSSGQHFRMEIDGQDVSGRLEVPNTGGWQSWQTIRKENLSLSQGQHVIRLIFGSEFFNLNHIAFTKSAVTGIDSGLKATISSIRPNPSNSNFVLQLGATANWVRVISMQGVEVYYNHSPQQQELSFGNSLTPGIYVAHIYYKTGKSEAQRVVKIK